MGVLSGIALLAPAAGGAHASELHLSAANVVAFSSDGTRYAAWQESPTSRIAILDTSTGRTTDLVAPTGCSLRDQSEVGWPVRSAASGRFLLDCDLGASQSLLNVATGASTPLPTGVSWEVVGDRFIKGQRGDECTPSAPCQALYEISTGKVRYVSGAALTNVDRGGVSPAAFCPAVRRLVRAFTGGLESLYAATASSFVHRSGRRGNVGLDRCHGRPTILAAAGRGLMGDGAPANFDLRGGLLSWDTGSDPTSGLARERPFRGRLYAYRLVSHQRESWLLPRTTVSGGEGPVAGTFGYSSHTSNTVFWVASRAIGGTPTLGVQAAAIYSATVR